MHRNVCCNNCRKKDISNSKKVAFFLMERVNSTISISHLLRYISANLYKQNTPKKLIFGVFYVIP